MYQPSEARIEEVHSRLLGYGDYANVGAACRLVGLSGNLVRACLVEGLERGWYETRPSADKRNPRTGEPAVEYKAVRR
ncbi:hypothetical protein EV649_1387 [Kribbella sp. VKM Ac-2569]|uniref:hypothetical protein n=1 Tax=Kribbella sp. VKM Ac-2569 TaxID=2512220 RepID=UPI00102C79B9|nr:hypothetical protein [Kribbella sp. VKM Ac-2569]RZT27617.1 hypothetical protein EV649_1387 [Kribbella sp. VKM Ac-2569]